MNLTDIEQIKKIMSRHGFSFSKALGQNFITNPEVCPLMAEMSGITPDCGVIEIGAGVGVLTVELAKRAAKAVSVELDTRLIPVLSETLRDYRNIEVVNADIMKTDIKALCEEHFPGKKVYVCANLPYYITSPVIMSLLSCPVHFESITVMVQKEAGDRLCAEIGSRDSGAITVAVNYKAQAQKLFDVGKDSFTPSPKVDSQVIKLTPRNSPPVNVQDEEFFFETVKAAFSQRRKTAANGLSSGLNMSKQKVTEALAMSGLEAGVRAEALTMEQLAALSDNLLIQKNNG